MNVNEELESFSKLIRVLEDALERAAEILGPNERPSSRSRHTIESAAQVYENLSDLLDATLAGRIRILERQAR
jgi:hypothetical protein